MTPTLALSFNGLTTAQAKALLTFVPNAGLTISALTPAQTAQVLALFDSFTAPPPPVDETAEGGSGQITITGQPPAVSVGSAAPADTTITPGPARAVFAGNPPEHS